MTKYLINVKFKYLEKMPFKTLVKGGKKMEFITTKSAVESFINGFSDERVSPSKKKAIKKRLEGIAPEEDCELTQRQVHDIFEGMKNLQEKFFQQS
ncbi:MAG: hypothetical protein GF365_02405 [Candidatus Buchananbacteria bacterium]|nr:hypothetical protein [Candidatus Buchananbacteria bacterium]